MPRSYALTGLGDARALGLRARSAAVFIVPQTAHRRRRRIMSRYLGNLSAVLLVVAGLSHAGAATAQTVPYKEMSEGRLTLVTDTIMEWEAEGVGTHIGRYTEAGFHFYFDDGTLFGSYTHTAADGSTATGVFAGTFGPIGGGLVGFTVDAEWIDGTGRLDGLTGTALATAVLDPATGIFHAEAKGTWILP
jgi:hypothetical protein